MVYYFQITNTSVSPQPLLCSAGGVPHGLLLMSGPCYLDAPRPFPQMLNLVNMVRAQPAGGKNKAGPGPYTVQLGARVQDKRWQGWAAVFLVWGVRPSWPRQIRTGEFYLHHPTPTAATGVPKATTGVPMKASWGAGTLRYLLELTWAVVWCRCGLRQEAFLCCWQRLSVS